MIIFWKLGFGEAGPIPVVASAVATVLFLALVVLLLLRCKAKKKQQRDAREPTVEEEMNQVYGMYYFPDGGHIDQGRSEMADGNDYYGS